MKKILCLMMIAGCLSGCEKPTPNPTNKGETKAQTTKDITEKPPVETAKETKTAGNKKSIKVTKFFDFGCGYCRKGAQTMKKLKAQYGDQVDIQLMHFLIHPQVSEVHKASECAGSQGKFEAFFYRYFESHYGKVDQSSLRSIAQSVDVDTSTYDQCMKNPMSATVEAHKNIGTLLGVRGTPFFMINDEIPLRGAASYEQFTTAIDQLLATP